MGTNRLCPHLWSRTPPPRAPRGEGGAPALNALWTMVVARWGFGASVAMARAQVVSVEIVRRLFEPFRSVKNGSWTVRGCVAREEMLD